MSRHIVHSFFLLHIAEPFFCNMFFFPPVRLIADDCRVCQGGGGKTTKKTTRVTHFYRKGREKKKKLFRSLSRLKYLIVYEDSFSLVFNLKSVVVLVCGPRADKKKKTNSILFFTLIKKRELFLFFLPCGIIIIMITKRNKSSLSFCLPPHQHHSSTDTATLMQRVIKKGQPKEGRTLFHSRLL